MSSFQNHDSLQNQAGQQIVHGDVVFNDYGASHKRSRFGYDGISLEKRLDDDILAKLSFPHMTDRRSNVEPPHRRTCQWLFELDEYKTWDAKIHGLLWIKGLPGSGKSTLMSHLYSAHWLKQHDSANVHLEFFFTARGAPLQRTPLGMFRSLLNQIFYQDQNSRGLFRRLYQEKCASFGSSNTGWEWQLSELKKALTDLILACAQYRQVTIFVDALDEAGRQAAIETAHYFHTLNDHVEAHGGAIKTCISCRHYPVPSTARAVEIHVERHNREDIEAYVRDYLHIDDLSSELIHRQEIWLELLDHLVSLARGVFQWVRLVVPMVAHWMGDDYSLQTIYKQLALIPDELRDVYKHIVETVIDDHHRIQSLRLFQWVSLAIRPLSVTEMRYALVALDIKSEKTTRLCKCHETTNFVTSDDLMVSRVKSWSGGLIEVVSDTVQVIHQSVNDFLLNGGLELVLDLDSRMRGVHRSGRTVVEISGPTQISHSHLYFSCLNYLSLECMDLPGPDTIRTYDEEIKQNLSSRFPLLCYSAEYYLVHAQKAGTHRSKNLDSECQMLKQCLSAQRYADKVFKYYRWRWRKLRNNTTVLHTAAVAGLDDLIRYSIACHDEVESANHEGWTALHLATDQGHFSAAKILVDAGADIQRGTLEGETPLLLAASQGHTDLFSWLMARGSSMSVHNGTVSVTPLYAAAKNSHLAICRLCIDAGADVNAQERYFGNALQAAADDGSEEVVRLLLEAGADVNAQGGVYGNALQAALKDNSLDIVETLRAAGAEEIEYITESDGGSEDDDTNEAENGDGDMQLDMVDADIQPDPTPSISVTETSEGGWLLQMLD